MKVNDQDNLALNVIVIFFMKTGNPLSFSEWFSCLFLREKIWRKVETNNNESSVFSSPQCYSERSQGSKVSSTLFYNLTQDGHLSFEDYLLKEQFPAQIKHGPITCVLGKKFFIVVFIRTKARLFFVYLSVCICIWIRMKSNLIVKAILKN